MLATNFSRIFCRQGFSANVRVRNFLELMGGLAGRWAENSPKLPDPPATAGKP